MPNLLILVHELLSSADSSGPAGGDKTDLATSRRSSLHGGSLSDMLMVTTTMGMLDGVHSHTTDLRPAVTLGLVLVVGTSSLQHGLVNTSTAGDDSDHGAVGGRDDLLVAYKNILY